MGNSADLPIEIEDEEEEITEVRKPLMRRQTRRDTRIQDKDLLCEFPLGESPSVAVTFKDYKTLEHDTWLNDLIINFSLAWLHREELQRQDRARVYIFDTLFYR